MRIFVYSIVLVTLLSFTPQLSAQQTDQDRGVELYKKGDYKNAISVLSQSTEVEGLYYLGLSYEQANQKGKALDAYKTAFANSYDVFFKKFDGWQNTFYSDSKPLFSDLLRDLRPNNELGRAASEKVYELKQDFFRLNEWRTKAKILLEASDLAKSDERIYSSRDKSVETVKILAKPRAEFIKDAHGRPVLPPNVRIAFEKDIILFVVYGADGTIKLAMPAEDEITVFTVSALTAASKIKFQPAVKDGKPVTVYTKVSYRFSMR